MIGVKKTSQQGFALFLTIVIMGIILAATIATVDIGVKEYMLSGGDRESQQAFYAADRALECTMYADFGELKKSGQSAFEYLPSGTPELNPPIKCSGYRGNFTKTTTDLAPAVGTQNHRSTITTFSLGFANNTEATVSVTKDSYDNISTGDTSTRTTIILRGYNTTDINNPRRVERAIRLQY